MAICRECFDGVLAWQGVGLDGLGGLFQLCDFMSLSFLFAIFLFGSSFSTDSLIIIFQMLVVFQFYLFY